MSKTRRDKKRHFAKRPDVGPFDYDLCLRNYFASHPCTHKKMNKRSRRSKENQAVHTGQEPPKFKKSDNYNYHMDW